MKVYAHYHLDQSSKTAYRWRTLLKFGTSWEVLGTVFIQYPGTSSPQSIVEDKNTIAQLTSFEASHFGTWHEFKPCPTMRAIEKLFTERLQEHTLNGAIQIFHLTNVCGGEKKDQFYEEVYAHTTSIDNTFLTAPIYLGWGDINKLLPHLRSTAHLIFNLVLAPAFDQHYLISYFDKNAFVHPLSLMTTNKDTFESKLYHRSFIENTTKPEGINELLHQHHMEVKNASRCQEILDFLPSFNIAPFTSPKRKTSNSLVLTSPQELHIDILCEEHEFTLHLYHPMYGVDEIAPLKASLLAHGFQEKMYSEHQSYIKFVPVYFVENIYTDIQAIATFLREKS